MKSKTLLPWTAQQKLCTALKSQLLLNSHISAFLGRSSSLVLHKWSPCIYAWHWSVFTRKFKLKFRDYNVDKLSLFYLMLWGTMILISGIQYGKYSLWYSIKWSETSIFPSLLRHLSLNKHCKCITQTCNVLIFYKGVKTVFHSSLLPFLLTPLPLYTSSSLLPFLLHRWTPIMAFPYHGFTQSSICHKSEILPIHSNRKPKSGRIWLLIIHWAI